MENGLISDEQISASSEWDEYHAAIQGRLRFQPTGFKAGSWVPGTTDTNQWLQVDLDRLNAMNASLRNAYKNPKNHVHEKIFR